MEKEKKRAAVSDPKAELTAAEAAYGQLILQSKRPQKDPAEAAELTKHLAEALKAKRKAREQLK
jgi:hypothetical protein